MAYKTCPDCGCRIFEYGCVNCNEIDYITMQDDAYEPRPSDKIKVNNEQNDERSIATKMPNEPEAGEQNNH